MARVVFFLIGLLLSVTAILKLWMLITDPFADLHAGFPISVLWLGVLIEGILIFVILRDNSFSLKWIATFQFFVAMFFLSTTRLLMGYSSCGCTGAIVVPSWISIMGNLGVLVALVYIARKQGRGVFNILSTGANELRAIPSGARGAMTGVLVVGLIFSISQEPILAHMADNYASTKIAIDSVDFGEITAGETANSAVHIRNLSNDNFQVIGGARSCQCVALQTKNLRIPPGENVKVAVNVTPFSHSIGVFRHRITFFLDKNPRRVSVDLVGFVKESIDDEKKHE